MSKINSIDFQEVKGMPFQGSILGQSKAFTHVYFIDGLLIDTGHSRKRKQVWSAIENFPIEQVLITHHHEDHTGNLQFLRSQREVPVYASPLCCEMMKNPPALSLAQKLYWGSRASYSELLPLEKTITTKHHSFEIIPVKGHAPDMIVLYEPDKKWLFSADLYINSRMGYFLESENIYEQITSIRKVLHLDFDTLFCSHNPQIEGGKAKLTAKLEFLESFVDDVSRLHRQGLTEKEIFKALRLNELKVIKLLSGGALSKMNMVRSVVRGE